MGFSEAVSVEAEPEGHSHLKDVESLKQWRRQKAVRRRKKSKSAALKAKGGKHFRKNCGLGDGGRVSNAEGIKLGVTVPKR